MRRVRRTAAAGCVSYIRDTGIRKPASQVLNPAQDTFDIPELRPVQEMLGHFDADDDTGYRNADLLLDGESCSPTSKTCNAGRT